jgi:hypothetical protein
MYSASTLRYGRDRFGALHSLACIRVSPNAGGYLTDPDPDFWEISDNGSPSGPPRDHWIFEHTLSNINFHIPILNISLHATCINTHTDQILGKSDR